MTKEERINHITTMFQELTPEEEVTRSTKIRGTTIEKLCEFGGPGYYRVEKWLMSKLTPKVDDMTLAKDQFQRSFELMKSRNSKYGDSWKVLTIPSIANLCEMKLHRIANMDSKNLDPKIEDELRDTCNYMIFALIKYQNEIKSHNTN